MFDLKLLNLALGFYTRLPVPEAQDYSRLPQASLYLPLVGWLVGGLSGLCFYLADIFWPQSTAVILALVFGILFTGAFHEDGFGDVCDGFGGGYGKERILGIMKDSRIGAYGAIGIFLIMALKISLLASLSATFLPFILVSAHSISRFQPLLIMRFYDYARIDVSKSGSAMYKPSLKEMVTVGSISLLPLLFLPLVFGFSILFMLLASFALGQYFYKHIGGYTGDCLGAVQQVSEVVFYLAVSTLWTFT